MLQKYFLTVQIVANFRLLFRFILSLAIFTYFILKLLCFFRFRRAKDAKKNTYQQQACTNSHKLIRLYLCGK